MKDLVIVGAGGFGREAYYLAKELSLWNIKGFIGNAGDTPSKYKINYPMLGVIEEYVPNENEVFAMGIASPKLKEKFANILKSKGAKFVTLIHPAALINETVEIGEGCIITACSGVSDCSKIGNFVHIAGSLIGQDVEIGDYTTTTAYVNIPNTTIGKRCFIGSHSVIFGKLEDDVEVVAGSVVFHKVKSGLKVMGCPAKKIEL